MSSFLVPLAALGSATVFGTSDFLGGVFSKRYNPIAAVGWAHLTAFLLLSIGVAASPWPTSLAWLPYCAVGWAGAAGLVCFYRALATGTMGVVSPIAALGVLVPLGVALAGGERPRPLQIAGIVAALVGAVLASGPEARHVERVRAHSVFWAVAAAVGFGMAMWGMIQGSRISTMHTMWGMRGASTLAFVVAAIAWRSVGGIGARDLPKFMLLGVLELLGNILMVASTKLGLVSIGVVLSSLYPVPTILLAAIFLSERLTGVQRGGVVAALLGIVLINLP